MKDSSLHNSGLDREFLDLLWGLCEEQLTEQEAARLNELLLADRNRRRALLQFMQMAAGLEWEHSGLGGKAPEAAARAWYSAGTAGPCGIDPPPSVSEGPGSLTAFAGAVDQSAVARTAAQSFAVRRPPLILSLVDWLQPRRIISVSRAAAAILLIGMLTLGVLGTAAVTMAVMKSPAQAGPVVSKNYFLGSRCIGRTERDLATGTVCFVRHPTTVSGRASSFSFYNVHADNDRWITPIILALDPTTSTYRITGIGQPVLNLGSGLQTVPFQLVAGSGDLQAGVHTFGFYHGTVDKTGKATSASQGPLDFDPLPEPDGSGEDHDAEARWLFVPWDATPVQLRLDLEFNLAARPIQVTVSPGTETPRERIYSGRLEIVANPQLPAGGMALRPNGAL